MRRALFSLAALALLACEATPPAVAPRPLPVVAPPPPAPPPAPAPAETPDAEFRKEAPRGGPQPPFAVPEVQEIKLSNGIRVLAVERHDLPIVALQIVSTRGASQASHGVGSLVGAMLFSGTKKHSALELSDLFEGLGAEHWSTVSYDSGALGVKVLSSKLPEALDLLAEALREPTFPKDELKLEVDRRRTSLKQERDNPSRLLQRAVGSVLFPPKHPYAQPLIGDDAALERVSSADLAAFHRAQFQPDRLVVAVAGDFVKADLIASLEKSLGSLKGKAEKAREVQAPPPPDKNAPRVVILDRPGASQSNVSVAMVGVPRNTADFEAILLMNTILGGQFSSRININLREKHGYTYGAGSSFAMNQGAGPFSISGAIVSEHTAAAIREIFAEVDAIRSKPVSDDELNDAKNYLIQALPARFESAAETASTLAALTVYGLPLDEFQKRPARINRATKEDVQKVAERLLKTDQMRVVIVGDAEKIKPAIDELKLGKVEVRKPTEQAREAPKGGKGAGAKEALKGGKDAPKPQPRPKKK